MKNSTLDTPIEYLKGVGPAKGEMLRKEQSIFTLQDLLYHFPFRHIDRTKFHRIRDLTSESGEVQLKGELRRVSSAGEGRRRRLVGQLRDDTGAIELVWFQGVTWLEKSLQVGKEYVVYGRVSEFNRTLNIAHPEVELVSEENVLEAATFAPVYSGTEKLNSRGLDSRAKRKLMHTLLGMLRESDLPENLPLDLLHKLKMMGRMEALQKIHFPRTQMELDAATNRLKFEELFYLQLRLLQIRQQRKAEVKGFAFEQVGAYFNEFFQRKLPFELTNAQKRVIKEIRKDLGTGIQMNRLLQGDVGSGKTIVALLCMLIALDNGFQCCLMAPTEILAAQHFQSIGTLLDGMELRVEFLTGTILGKRRDAILERLANGDIDILIGTHAVLEEPVVFKNLGLGITDEQHRFGVEQRARLWKKSSPYPPHILVMSATPIPRTLAMTLYGDLDVSIIDELPPGRKDIVTVHRNETHRLRVIGFMKEQIAQGRQVYVVYPLIEESEALDLANLMAGYEAVHRDFPMPEYQVSIVHGKMKAADKDFEMQRFVSGTTQIMVATTVVEVGVNVPNASVMVVESAERFGLSQLHQLRGRVGRGADQSYCILMTSYKLSNDARERLRTMCRTNNGFEIADVDLKLRGPGNIEGTQQSGIINFRIADLAKDGKILQTARDLAKAILEADPQLSSPANQSLKVHLQAEGRKNKIWSRIS
jgi:ATP-dependent DNA helicase RecG